MFMMFNVGADERSYGRTWEMDPVTLEERVLQLLGRRAQLTARERQVLYLLVRGCSTRQIAAQLGVAYETSKRHVGRALRKLGVQRRGLGELLLSAASGTMT